jgi:hypothetical protein
VKHNFAKLQLYLKYSDRTIARYAMFSKRKEIELELNELEETLSDKNSEYRIGYDSIKIQFDDDIVTKKDFETYRTQVDKVIKEEYLYKFLIILNVPRILKKAKNLKAIIF